jgi:malonyl-CoA O-methyltransferase
MRWAVPLRARLRSSGRELAPLAAYTLWAPTYAVEPANEIMRLEQEAVLRLLPSVRGQAVLDLACGTGRYLKRLQAGEARVSFGIDRVPAMLAKARAVSSRLVCADFGALPVAGSRLDLVVCALAVGHAASLGTVLREVARVLRPGGAAVYSDLHPDAAASGWKRSFTDLGGRVHSVQHHVHSKRDHEAACSAAGLEIEELLEPVVDFAHPWNGRPAVLALRARRASARAGRR